MKLHPSTYCILNFTPGARWRHPRDHFWPLFWCAVAVLAGLIAFLVHLEALYREDARSRNTPGLRQDAREALSVTQGAEITGMKDGHVTLSL